MSASNKKSDISFVEMEKALGMTPNHIAACKEDLDGPEDYIRFVEHLYDTLVVPGYWVQGDLNATYANCPSSYFE